MQQASFNSFKNCMINMKEKLKKTEKNSNNFVLTLLNFKFHLQVYLARTKNRINHPIKKN
jgi:hypothetical protein